MYILFIYKYNYIRLEEFMLNIDIKKTNNYKPKLNIDDSLEFGTVFTDHMFIMDYTSKEGWENPRI